MAQRGELTLTQHMTELGLEPDHTTIVTLVYSPPPLGAWWGGGILMRFPLPLQYRSPDLGVGLGELLSLSL